MVPFGTHVCQYTARRCLLVPEVAEGARRYFTLQCKQPLRPCFRVFWVFSVYCLAVNPGMQSPRITRLNGYQFHKIGLLNVKHYFALYVTETMMLTMPQ